MKNLFLVLLAISLWTKTAVAQQRMIDCSCLATQAVLITNACQAVVPDMCQFTNCFISTVVPPPPVFCSQTPAAGTPVGPGTHTITVTVMDASGVAEQCALTFTVTATQTGPFSLQCAPDKTVECGTQWGFDPPTPINACCPQPGVPNGGVTITVISTTTNGACPTVYTRTWQATDSCGHVATCKQTVTVRDTTAPILTCAPNAVVECGNPVVFTPPTAFDACDGTNLQGGVVSTVTNTAQNCPDLYTVTRTWRVIDSCGNVATCSQTIRVQDTTPPVLTCASNVVVECGNTFAFTAPTASDACSGTNVSIVILSTSTNTPASCPTNLVIIRTWHASDPCGNFAVCSQTITIRDTTPPVLTCAPNAAVECGNPIVFTPPTVFDACDGANVQVGVLSTVTNTAGVNCPDRFIVTRTWRAVDRCGNATTCSQTIRVQDTTPPTLTCATNLVVACGNSWSFTAPTAVDGCDGANVVVTILSTVTNQNVGCPTNMVIVRTWRASDSCGNNSTCSQTVTVAGGNPTLNCNALAGLPILRTNGCQGVIPDLCPFAIAQAQQNCPCPLTCSQNPPPGTPVGIGPHPITVTLTDGSGNSVSCTVVFQVLGGNQTRVWNTGMGGPNGSNPLPPGTQDPNYTLVSWPAGGCSGPAQVQDPTTIPVPPWLANGPDSQWIGPALSTINCAPGLYHYRLCFYLDCTDGAAILGQWSSDDWGTLHLNGQPTGYTIPSTQLPNNGYDVLHPVAITNGFICGMNCLDFYVTNAGTWTGLRAQFTNVFNDCCCKPQSSFSIYSGMDAAGGPLPQGAPDNRFTFTCQPPGVFYPGPVVVNPHPIWLPNGPNSQWIGPDPANQSAAGGVYCYTLRFDLPPCPSGVFKASLTGRWSADDTGTIFLNGNPTGNTLPSSWAFTNWQAINITSGLVPGLNTLTFYVTNLGNSSTGMRLELAASTSCCDCTNICTVSIQCPTAVTRTVCGTNGIVAYAPPTATSSCGLPVTVVCNPPSGSAFPLGMNPVTCTATDSAGNSSSCNFAVIVQQDNTPPSIDCVCLQQQVRPVRACNSVIPDLCKFTQCFSDTCTTNLACSQSPPAGTPVGPGSYLITVTVTDSDGNSSQCQVQFDVIAPTDTRVWNTGASGAQAANFVVIQTPSGPVNNPAVTTAVPGAWLPNDATSRWLSFTGNSANAPAGVYIYRLTFSLPCTVGASITGRFMSDDAARIYLNGLPTPALSTSFSSWTPVNLTSGFVSGVNTLDIYVTNAVIWTGIRTELTNKFSCCCPEAIAMKCPKFLSAWVCGSATSAQVPFTVPAYSLCPSSNVTVSVTCVPPSPGPFPLGTTLVTCTATDSLGNQTKCTFPVTVVKDNIPPVITCPAPITIATCSNSVRVNYKATAKDDCSPTVSISCVPPSGSLFAAGTTTIVTCTATDACGNKSSCSFPVKIISNLLWQMLAAGVNDCYTSAFEPATPGPCLVSAYSGLLWKPFDNTTVNRGVGHTWNFPLSWNILAAKLATRVRPPANGCAGGSANDSIQLGLNNCVTPSWLWSRYFGAGNASPGLVESTWCNGNGCNFSFSFDLTALPPVSGPAINLLPHMNSTKRLDILYQDDTTVDYANLLVLRCAPQSVFGGFDTTLNNAQLVRGPVAFWCIVKESPNLPNWTARINFGGAEAVAQPMRYRCKPSAWDLKSNVKARTAGGDESTFAGFSLSHASDSPTAELRLTDSPPGVTEVQVLFLRDGALLSSETFPASPDAVLATFDDATEYLGVLYARNEGFFDIARTDGQPGYQVCVRFLPEPPAMPLTALEFDAAGIDEFDVAEPQVRSIDKLNAIQPTGEAVALASDGIVSVSPLDPESGAPVGLRWRRPRGIGSQGEDGVGEFHATNELTAYVEAILPQTAAGNTNRPRQTFTATATFSDMSSRALPPVIFTSSPGGFTASSEHDGAPLPIHRVQVWSNATLVVDVPNPASVECASLPPIYRVIGTPWYVDADICHRFPFNKRETVRINGTAYECSELRINLPSFAPQGESVEGLLGLDVQASGVDGLALSRVIAGPVPLRFMPPVLASEDDGSGVLADWLHLNWDQPWPALERAPSVNGPWLPVPTDGTDMVVPVHQGGPLQFFRLKE